jgi:hypothetical protein
VQTTPHIPISDIRAHLNGKVIVSDDPRYDDARTDGGIVLDLAAMNAVEAPVPPPRDRPPSSAWQR